MRALLVKLLPFALAGSVLAASAAFADPPLSPDDLAKLDDALLDRSSAMKVRLEAALILARVGTPEAVPSLIEALGDPEMPVRAAASRALGDIGDARAADGLFGRLRDPERFVRGEAHDAIIKLVQRGYGRALAGALHHWDPQVREKVCAIGGELGPGLGDGILALGISDKDANVRAAAQHALATWPPPQLQAFLLAQLDSDAPPVRAAAAQLLGEHHVSRAVPRLMQMLVSPRETRDTVAAARFALRDMSDQVDAAHLIDQARHGTVAEKQQALAVLAAIHDGSAFDLLIAALDAPELSLRSAAAQDLAVLGDTRASTRLAVMAERPENAPIVRELQNALTQLQGSR